jgi:hypothetical protein
VQDLVTAITSGNSESLMQLTRALRKSEDITGDQANKITLLATSANFARVAPSKAQVEEDASEDGVTDLENLIGRNESIALEDATYIPPSGIINVPAKLSKWMRLFDKGKLTLDRAVSEITGLHERLRLRTMERRLRQLVAGKARGADWFEERLARALRTGELNENVVELMRWLIRQNPAVATDLAISIRALNSDPNRGAKASGNYNVAERIVMLASDANISDVTGAHEMLHHTERMMPADIREGIMRAYTRELINEWKINKLPEARAYLEKALDMVVNGAVTKTNTKELEKLLIAIGKAETNDKPLHHYYQFFNPSEYWAVNGSNLVQGRATADSWVAKAKQWLKEFVEKLKSIVGISNKSEIIAALDSILKSDGKFLAKQLLSTSTTAKNLATPTKEETKTLINASNAEKFIARSATRMWETLAQKALAFEQEIARVLNAGGKVTPESDIVDALVRFNGLKNDRLSLDESEVGAGVYNWFTENWQDYGATREEALRQVNKFLHNTHVLERNHILWLMKSKLGAGKSFDRETILTNLAEGKLGPDKARNQLERLVGQHAVETEAQYGAKAIEDYDKLLATLVELKQQGIDKKSMAELNERLTHVRDRTLTRNIESGYISEDDPWVKFYGFEWYVPLKGTRDAEANSAIADLDVEGRQGRAELARINKQIETMSGRKSIADSPLEQLLMDMSLAGRNSAQQDFVGSVYQFVLDNNRHIGAQIEVYEGTPKNGYRQVGGKKKKTKEGKEKTFYRKLPASDKGFLYHQGDTHYRVILPNSSLLLRGILQMGNEANLTTLDKVVGKGTNILSKLYTTMNPLWQTFVALPRDLTYMPVMMAVREKENPLEALPLMGRYLANLLKNAPGQIPAAAEILFGDRINLVQYAKENEDSTVAWLRRYEENGGSTNFTAGFNVETLGNKLTSTYNNSEGVWALNIPWKKWEGFTSNYASLLENIGRVAAFRTLVESGMSDREAAAKVKDYLNYDQSGTHGRKINSYLQFFKVGMTGADAMRKSFMGKDGKFQTKKFVSYLAFFMVIGAAKYFMDRELFGQDEKGEWNIKKFKLDTLTQKALIKYGDKTVGFNFGLGLPQMLLGPGMVMGALMAGDAEPEEGTRALYELVSRNAPVRPDLAVSWTTGSLVPAPIAGIAAVKNNQDAFGRPIHTGFPSDDLDRADQARGSTPDAYSGIATWMRDTVGVDMYPEDIRYLMRTYGGQPASLAMKVFIDADAEADAGGEAQVIGRVTGAQVLDTDFYMRNEAYEALSKLSAPVKRLGAVTKKADRLGTDKKAAERQFLAATPGAAAQIAAYKELNKAIDAYNKSMKAVRANKISGQGWKEAERKKVDGKLRQAYEKAKAALPEE